MEMKTYKRKRTALGVNQATDSSLVKAVNEDLRLSYRPGHKLLAICKGDFYGIAAVDVGEAIHLAIECLQYAEAEAGNNPLDVGLEIRHLSQLLAARWPESSQRLIQRAG